MNSRIARPEDALVEYGFRRFIVTITAQLAALLAIVDSTIVNVAINDMKGNLGVTLSEVGWVITAFAIGNVIVIPLTTWLSQQFGRRNYFAASIIIFTIFSFLCGNSHSIAELIVYRFIQGIGGGALLVTAQTIITESYPIEKRGMSQAIYGLGVIIGPTLGPPLGGYIVDNFSWPYIFYINIPVGIIATLLTLRYVKSPKYVEKTASRNIDFLGIILLSIAVGSLQYVLEKGQDDDWFSDNLIVTLSVVFVFGTLFFIWREMVYKQPVVDLKVLKNGNLRIGTILSFLLGFGLYGSTFIVPLYTQSILGWTAEDAGLLFIPSGIATGLMMPVIGWILQKGVKENYIVIGGLTIFFIYSFWGYKILTPDTPADAFWWPLIVRGLGLSMLFIPITTLALSTLHGKEIGDGAAFTGMMRQLGGSFGVAAIATYISHQNSVHRMDIIGHLDPSDPIVQQRLSALQHGFFAKGMPPNVALQSAHQVLEFSVDKQSAVMSYMDVFLYIGVLFLLCIPIMLLVRGHREQMIKPVISKN
ncbi:MAG: DHA2 family efflux MFS transporter permease subunit [Chitinophagaceae bacterium]|nr:DHA2 family efflux MFS transporter permease subunit [Chitinophagaceae bacterium]